jgi:hypothetical protein
VRIHIAAKGGGEGVSYRERGRENEIRKGGIFDLTRRILRRQTMRFLKKIFRTSKEEVSSLKVNASTLKEKAFFSRKGYYQASLGYCLI